MSEQQDLLNGLSQLTTAMLSLSQAITSQATAIDRMVAAIADLIDSSAEVMAQQEQQVVDVDRDADSSSVMD